MKSRILLIKSLGFILLIVGLFSLYATFAEFSSFYAFSEGGRYHYEGFGFGSLMFAFITFNVMAYLSLALLCIPAGIGNFKMKKWGQILSLASLKTLFILGVAASTSILLSFNLFQIVTLSQLLILLLFTFLLFILLPFGFIRFYQDARTEELFRDSSEGGFLIQQLSGKLTLILLNFFWIFILCQFIFLKGAFPFLGRFIFLEKGIHLLSMTIFALLILIYLFFHDYHYASCGMMIYCILLFFILGITFLKNSTGDFLNLLHLPAYERENVLPAFAIPEAINSGLFFSVVIFIQGYLILIKFLLKSTKNSIIKRGSCSSIIKV